MSPRRSAPANGDIYRRSRCWRSWTTGNNIGQPILNGVVTDELKAAIARVLAAAHKAGKKCGIYCANGAQAKASAAQGFDMINVATDYTSLEALVKEELSVASSQAKPERGVSY
ncbi:Pyruvate/Phosphoenolpyruvate kinase [Cordyceps militaris CM01]|uniref:Pyruvate/Phosphoenolpyruvate kinase n=1 Tax=Cordyceps militaris (strain CM01) TaxID=983644 RepID=G3JLR5_CORMM|nr:Pyruvate/Phosphoenolpyruvate kinase [Cordyceps militaris CM01]EGX90639.1 Pyruvate/Phosphoenolpyruvate kinase [Cordyceps militaris CM01]